MPILSTMTVEEKIGQLICACSSDWPSLDQVVAAGGAGAVYGCLDRQGYTAGAAACLCTYGECPDSAAAAVMVLYGEMKTIGKLPVSIGGKYAYGSGL